MTAGSPSGQPLKAGSWVAAKGAHPVKITLQPSGARRAFPLHREPASRWAINRDTKRSSNEGFVPRRLVNREQRSAYDFSVIFASQRIVAITIQNDCVRREHGANVVFRGPSIRC